MKTNRSQNPAQKRSSRENNMLFQLAGAKGNISHLQYTLEPEYRTADIKKAFSYMNSAIDYIEAAIFMIKREQEERKKRNANISKLP